MKKITMYKTFYHYGCSMTAGYDAAGDNKHSIELSYPAHLADIIGNNYENRARHGSSNDINFMQLFADLHNNIIQEDSCVIFNLTQPSRFQYIGNDAYVQFSKLMAARYADCWFEPMDPMALLSFIELKETVTDTTTEYYFSPLTAQSENTIDVYNKLVYSYMTQDDIAFYFNLIRNIYAANAVCAQYNVPVVFLDFYAGLNTFEPFVKYPIQLDNLFYREKSITRSNPGADAHRSKTLHFYSEGYRLLANDVFHMIKDYEC